VGVEEKMLDGAILRRSTSYLDFVYLSW